MSTKSVTYVENSKNSKLSSGNNVDATYSSISKTCSNTCPLKGTLCYAELGHTGIVVSRLDESPHKSALEVAREEANLIDKCYDGEKIPANKILRLHVSGDSRTIQGTKLLASACKRWKKRGGAYVYTYTHSWKNVPRSTWGEVSVLASIENTSQVKLAKKNGYVPAIVVEEHLSDKAYYLDGSDIKWIPCPAQTKDRTCDQCKLCFDDLKLKQRNCGIAFSVHGARKKNIVKLKIIK